MSADLREDPAYVLNSYNLISFRTWEFHARRRVGCLGDLDYFDREITAEEDENNNDDGEDDEDDDDAVEAECETSWNGHVQGGDNDHNDGGPARDPETQPPDISEEGGHYRGTAQ